MDEESQKADEAEISMATRMAILLLTAEGQKTESPEKLTRIFHEHRRETKKIVFHG